MDVQTTNGCTAGLTADYQQANAQWLGTPPDHTSANCTELHTAGRTLKAINVRLHFTAWFDSASAATVASEKLQADIKNGTFVPAIKADLKGPGGTQTLKITVDANSIRTCTNCAAPKSPSPKPKSPSPPPKKAVIHGDPHVVDFTGKKFTYYGKPGTTMNIITSGVGANATSVKALLDGWPAAKPVKGASVMTQVTFKSLKHTAVITQIRAKATGPYSLKAKVTAANGTVYNLVPGTKKASVMLPGNFFVGAASASSVTVRTPKLKVGLSEGVLNGKTQGWINALVTVSGALPPPVGGVLGPSYNKAKTASPAHAKALATNTATMVASLDNILTTTTA